MLQHLYLGKHDAVCMVMTVLFMDDSLLPFLEEYLQHLLFSYAGHTTLSFLKKSDF